LEKSAPTTYSRCIFLEEKIKSRLGYRLRCEVGRGGREKGRYRSFMIGAALAEKPDLCSAPSAETLEV